MITIDEYDRVQALLGRRGRPRPKSRAFAFIGTMKCGECGLAITAEEKIKTQKNGNVHRYIYYHCTKKSGPCTQGSIEESKLMEQITDKLMKFEFPDSFHQWGMKWLENENAKEIDLREGIRTTQQKSYDEAVQMLDRYSDMRAREELSEDEYREKKEHWLKEKKRRFGLLNDTDARITRWANNMESAFKFVTRAKEEFENGSLEKRRRIFLAIGSNLTLKDRIVGIDVEKTLLPMRRLADAIRDIHAALEPQKDRMNQSDYEEIYSQSPIVSARLDSNQRPFA